MAKCGRKPTPIERRMSEDEKRRNAGICLNESELYALDCQARRNQMGRSEYVRHMVREKDNG